MAVPSHEMNPSKVERNRVMRPTDLPNIGRSGADDLRRIGIHEPRQLIGRCPFALYESLCEKTGKRHDPCVVDVFISVARFMSDEAARP